MLDKHIVPVIRPPLKALARHLDGKQITADQVTLAGFLFGLLSIALVAGNHPLIAMLFLFLNRLADGIDGELARINSPTDAGGFLDITLDFIFYALFPLGFAIANPEGNALAAAVLITSFVGTGTSFLSFSSMAEKKAISHPDFSYKGFYYLNGLAEGTETILCFAIMCLLPQYFTAIAYSFALICFITTINRAYFGYTTLKKMTPR